MVVTRSNIAKALQCGVNEFWGMGYKDLPLQLEEIFDTQSSSKAYEEDVQLVGTGLMPVKPEGSAIAYDNIRQGITQRYTHLTYAMGIIFTHEMLMDKQIQLGLKQAKYLGRSARQTQETIAANILNRAFDPAYTWGDGTSLINTAHPRISGGTYSNRIAVDADLSEAALEAVMTQIRNLEDDRGLKIAAMGVTLVVPPALAFEAARILKSTNQSGNDLNNINVLRSEYNIKLVVNNYLTDPDAWFVLTDIQDGLKRFVREKISSPVHENDFDTNNIKYKVMFRESYGVTDPRRIFGSGGS